MKGYLKKYINNREFPSYNNILGNTGFIQNYFINESHSRTNQFQNKVVIVTGASSGIGKAISLELARYGAKVVLASRNADKLDLVWNQINKSGGFSIPIPTDVSEEKQCKKLIKRTLDIYGKIDILINNAGISMRANFLEVELSVLQRIMDTNFWGTVYCTKYALPSLIENKGSLVGISSICGITPLPGRTGYVASKHAVDGFLETIRIENQDKDFHVLLVHPGFTTSNIRDVALNKYGMPQAESPLNEDKLMPAERVAREVINGIAQKKREITLTIEGRLITWLYKRVPNVAEKLIYHEMKNEVKGPF